MRLGYRQQIYLKRLYEEAGIEGPVPPEIRVSLEGLQRRGLADKHRGTWVLTPRGREVVRDLKHR